MAFLDKVAIQKIGFKHLGNDVLISDKVSIYNAANISIDDNSRIDDFCLLSAGSGGIFIGKHVHLACYVSLIGSATIRIDDFAGLSGRTTVYSSSDDFSGEYLTGPTVNSDFTNVVSKPVYIGRHVIAGTGCVILPGITIQEGVALGAMALVNHDCEAFGIYIGAPAKRVKSRSKKLLELEKDFLLKK